MGRVQEHRHVRAGRCRDHPQLAGRHLDRRVAEDRPAEGVLGGVRGLVQPRSAEEVPLPADERAHEAVAGIHERDPCLLPEGRRAEGRDALRRGRWDGGGPALLKRQRAWEDRVPWPLG